MKSTTKMYKCFFLSFVICTLQFTFLHVGLFAQNYQWAKSIGSTDGDYGNSIATDNSGNVYIIGFFYGTADFDPSSGTANLTAVGSSDIFFAKYDNNGNYLWAKRIGSTDLDMGFNIAIDISGNVYITGEFYGTADFDPGSGTVNLTPVGISDIFFAKYDNNGNYIWAKMIGSTSGDGGNSIATDNSGNVYITGYFQGTADFDPGSGTASMTAVGYEDIFFAKYDNNGNYLWAKKIGSTSDDIGYSIATDPSGNVYIIGYFTGTADFDPGSGTANLTAGYYDIFFAKYDNNGNYLWAKSIGSTYNDEGYSIATDISGNVYITGYFGGTADFAPGPATAYLNPVGLDDIFFAKYDNNGNYLWAKNIGSTDYDWGNCIATDNSGNVYITGAFEGTADFDPGSGTANLTPVGDEDIFFAKYDNNGNYLWAKNIGSTDWDVGTSIATDNSDNVYITGYFSGIADFDPSSGTANLTAVGSYDIFFAKYGQTIGIEELCISLNISIFPNPSTDIITIIIPKKSIIEILNINGQIIKTISLDNGNTSIDLKDLSSGVYLIKAMTDKEIVTKKIIKE